MRTFDGTSHMHLGQAELHVSGTLPQAGTLRMGLQTSGDVKSDAITLLLNNDNNNCPRKHGGDGLSDRKNLIKPKKKQIVFLCISCLLGFYIFMPLYRSWNDETAVSYHYLKSNLSLIHLVKNQLSAFPAVFWEASPQNYLVNTETCKLLDMNPFDSAVTKFIKDAAPQKCKSALVHEENQMLAMDKSMQQSWKYTGSQCCFRKITRVAQSSNKYDRNADWGVAFSSTCTAIPADGNVFVNESYVKVECKNDNKIRTGVDFYGIVLPPEKLSTNVQDKLRKWDGADRKAEIQMLVGNKLKDKEYRPPNVLIIGIDSISRLHMIRSLPKTKTYLEANDFIELKGYTKMGENTFPNVMGFMAGMELNKYSSCWTSPNQKVDDCPFLWKNFSDNGYLTSLVEDSPGLAIFNYAKTGFLNEPVDYYLRPIMVAQHLHYRINKYSGHSHCLGGGLTPTEFLMKYIRNILALAKPRKYPTFIFSWFTSIGHDDMNLLKTDDDNFKTFLEDMVSSPKYDSDNTVIFFISDHGYRFGSFRETFLGFYEESLPFFFVRMPQRLKQQFPGWYKNLKENSHRLTSPLDLHETLKDILKLSSTVSSNDSTSGVEEVDSTMSIITTDSRTRFSFFEPTPLNRTCESCGIPNQYCMCGVMPELASSSEILQRLGKSVLDDVNKNVLATVIASKLCVPFKFSKVLYGRHLSAGDVWNNFGKLVSFNMYLVALEVSPGSVRFEAKIKQFENSTEIIEGFVNRINSYQGQSECMTDGFLKKYCFCQSVFDNEKKKKGRKAH